MLNDILNTPTKIEIDEQVYELEFDNKAYAQVELQTGKGLFKLYSLMIRENNMSYSDMVEIICAGLIKHNKADEVETVRKKLANSPWIIASNFALIQYAFVQPMIPPKIMEDMNKFAMKKPVGKKKTTAKK